MTKKSDDTLTLLQGIGKMGNAYVCPECDDIGTVEGAQLYNLHRGRLRCAICAGDTGRDVYVQPTHKPEISVLITQCIAMRDSIDVLLPYCQMYLRHLRSVNDEKALYLTNIIAEAKVHL